MRGARTPPRGLDAPRLSLRYEGQAGGAAATGRRAGGGRAWAASDNEPSQPARDASPDGRAAPPRRPRLSREKNCPRHDAEARFPNCRGFLTRASYSHPRERDRPSRAMAGRRGPVGGGAAAVASSRAGVEALCVLVAGVPTFKGSFPPGVEAGQAVTRVVRFVSSFARCHGGTAR
jgi:hypothetical protein